MGGQFVGKGLGVLLLSFDHDCRTAAARRKRGEAGRVGPGLASRAFEVVAICRQTRNGYVNATNKNGAPWERRFANFPDRIAPDQIVTLPVFAALIR